MEDFPIFQDKPEFLSLKKISKFFSYRKPRQTTSKAGLYLVVGCRQQEPQLALGTDCFVLPALKWYSDFMAREHSSSTEFQDVLAFGAIKVIAYHGAFIQMRAIIRGCCNNTQQEPCRMFWHYMNENSSLGRMGWRHLLNGSVPWCLQRFVTDGISRGACCKSLGPFQQRY